MSNTLSRDHEWSMVEGEFCEVSRFEPFATCKKGRVSSVDRTMPYALVALECREKSIQLAPETTGAIRHKLDFRNLWAAFVERGVSQPRMRCGALSFRSS